MQSRVWCFTWNNYPPDFARLLLAHKYEWISGQCEIGEGGTPHVQAVMGFRSSRRLTTLVRRVEGPHYEPARDVQASIVYCSKASTRVAGSQFQEGPVPLSSSQGKRGDLSACMARIEEQASLLKIVREFPAIAMYHPTGLRLARSVLSPSRDFKSKVVVAVGVPGSGKTRWALTFPTPVIINLSGGAWFDRYDPAEHRTVIFDEFYGGIPWGMLMMLMDRYPFHAPIKGGFINWRPDWIVFTSNRWPLESYPGMKPEWPAFQRRVDYELWWGADSPPIIRSGNPSDLPPFLH